MSVMDTETSRPGFLRRALRPTWTDLAPAVLGDGAASLDHDAARTWALVLASRHIPHKLRRLRHGEGGGYCVLVQGWFAERAAEEIRLYLKENAPGSGSVYLPDLRPVGGMEPTVGAMGALVVFFWLYSRTYPAFGLYPKLWLDLGSAHAGKILSGEWWRIFTALTLHGDGAHVFSNALIGGIFVWLASRRLGAGLAWLLTIVAGASGNLLNSMALAAPHNAIGFSTASFGAAGLLAGIAPFGVGGGIHGLGGGSLGRRVWRFVGSALVPIGAGLGLLAMLGAGEDTDLGAHLFGFVSGLMLGMGTGFAATRYGLPGRVADGVMYVLAISLPVLAWCFAGVVFRG